jgi:hypothetical protein
MKASMVAGVCNCSTLQAETSPGYIGRKCLKNKHMQNTKQNNNKPTLDRIDDMDSKARK